MAALQEAIKARPEPNKVAYRDHVFLTRLGAPWVRETASKGHVDSLSPALRRILTRLGIYKPKRTFYSLRHTFATWGDDVYPPDQKALAAMMGHAPKTMTDRYIHGHGIDRLRRIANGIHRTLFGQPAWPTDPTADPDNLPG